MDTDQQMELFNQFLRAEAAANGGASKKPLKFYQTPQFNLLFSAGFFVASIFVIRKFGDFLL